MDWPHGSGIAVALLRPAQEREQKQACHSGGSASGPWHFNQSLLKGWSLGAVSPSDTAIQNSDPIDVV